jgi:hypothetical protein
MLPGTCVPSTFGAGELNFCVRDGNRWGLSAITTGKSINLLIGARVEKQPFTSSAPKLRQNIDLMSGASSKGLFGSNSGLRLKSPAKRFDVWGSGYSITAAVKSPLI